VFLSGVPDTTLIPSLSSALTEEDPDQNVRRRGNFFHDLLTCFPSVIRVLLTRCVRRSRPLPLPHELVVGRNCPFSADDLFYPAQWTSRGRLCSFFSQYVPRFYRGFRMSAQQGVLSSHFRVSLQRSTGPSEESLRNFLFCSQR